MNAILMSLALRIIQSIPVEQLLAKLFKVKRPEVETVAKIKELTDVASENSAIADMTISHWADRKPTPKIYKARKNRP